APRPTAVSTLNQPNTESHPNFLNIKMASPQNESTVVVIVFISLGCLLFLALFAMALCFFVKKRKKKTEQGTDVIRKSEHLKVKEDFVKRPGGREAVVLTIEDDVHVEEAKRKKEMSGEGVVVGSSAGKITRDLAEGTSTPSTSAHQHLEH
ncbi:hypothetical protein NMG60_11017187, partial [Bertholletia excelsa]